MPRATRVTMTQESWQTTQAALLEAAITMYHDDPDTARELMRRIVRILTEAADSRVASEQERLVREHIGMPPVDEKQDVSRELVEPIEDSLDARRA